MIPTGTTHTQYSRAMLDIRIKVFLDTFKFYAGKDCDMLEGPEVIKAIVLYCRSLDLTLLLTSVNLF